MQATCAAGADATPTMRRMDVVGRICLVVVGRSSEDHRRRERSQGKDRGMFVGRSQRDGEITEEGEREGNDDRKITGGEKDHRGRRERDVGEKIPEGRKVWLGKMVGESLQRKLRSGA